MEMRIKIFNFPPFDEWYKKTYYKGTVGKYEVYISKFFNYCAVFTNFPLDHINFFDFDETQHMSRKEELKNLKTWYEESCIKINKEFENYIRTKHIAE